MALSLLVIVLICWELKATKTGPLSDTLMLEKDGATVVLSGLPESKEVNPPGFWVFDSPIYPNLGNPNFYGKCICLMHGPNPAYFPPPPWRSDAVGVVAVEGVGYCVAFSSDMDDETPPEEAIRFPIKVKKTPTGYEPVPGSPLCECVETLEVPINDVSAALNTDLYPLSNHKLYFSSTEHVIKPTK
eukprot:NODE_6543_length_872_cov_201.965287_g5948_i0.p1 GENE.NODE_6543_length_872_cov_201.965287_g5948_i0~~NODE_6543_length_872_cov_201.965287_g5948_i0.p1  ORF type:complete len:187 (-),score=35.22 NODE_6543_length_872_cov_201.965287_g5948_i0:240-800(-)